MMLQLFFVTSMEVSQDSAEALEKYSKKNILLLIENLLSEIIKQKETTMPCVMNSQKKFTLQNVNV